MTSLLAYQKPAFLPRLVRRMRERSAAVGGCLEWLGARDRAGYGITSAANKQHRTHRIAWEMAHGPIPDGMKVLHHCDNPSCIKTEPDEQYPDGHLFLGTPKDNTADMYRKGRAAPLTLYGAAKLNREQRDGIREMRAAGVRVADVAKQFGVSKNTVTSLAHYRTWWIDKETEVVASMVDQVAGPAAAAAADDLFA